MTYFSAFFYAMENWFCIFFVLFFPKSNTQEQGGNIGFLLPDTQIIISLCPTVGHIFVK